MRFRSLGFGICRVYGFLGIRFRSLGSGVQGCTILGLGALRKKGETIFRVL